MFKCKNCGAIFDEPMECVERHPYRESYAEEKFCVCPRCKDTGFEEYAEEER